MIYELRWKNGHVHRLGSDGAMSDEAEAALLDGAAQLVGIDDAGAVTIIIDVDGISAMDGFAPRGADDDLQRNDSRETSGVAVAGSPPETFDAIALVAIRVLQSAGSAAWWPGQCFEAVSDFDVVVAALRGSQPPGSPPPAIAVEFTLEWADGTTYESSLDPFCETLAGHLRRLLMTVLSKVVAVATAAARRDGDEEP